MTSGTTLNNPSDFTCKFLVTTTRNKEGYYCMCAQPCPNLLNVGCECPVIHIAREFEARVNMYISSGQASKDFLKEIKDVNKVT